MDTSRIRASCRHVCREFPVNGSRKIPTLYDYIQKAGRRWRFWMVLSNIIFAWLATDIFETSIEFWHTISQRISCPLFFQWDKQCKLLLASFSQAHVISRYFVDLLQGFRCIRIAATGRNQPKKYEGKSIPQRTQYIHWVLLLTWNGFSGFAPRAMEPIDSFFACTIL